MNIYEEVIKRGIEHDNHASDLYIPVNDETKELVNSYRNEHHVTTFKNNKDGKPWFDIPFAFEPFWDKAEKHIDTWVKGNV